MPALTDPIPLLQALVRAPSVTPETAGVLDILEKALTALGFSVERPVFSGDGSYTVENLFAIRDRGGKRLLLAGHTDVVPPGDLEKWTRDPFSGAISDGVLFGRGAADMKSGLAAMVAAIARMAESGADEAGTLALLITNDEEADAINGTDKLLAWATERGHSFDFAVVGEPSATAEVGDVIRIGRRGSVSYRITVSGKQGHVAYPDKALNPLPALSRIGAALSGTPLDAGTAHFPPSSLQLTSIDVGNPTSNVIPAQGSLRFNIRFNDLWTPEALDGWVKAQIAKAEPGSAGVSVDRLGRPSRVFRAPVEGPVVLLIETIKARTGRAPELSTGGGTSDGRFIAAYCPVVELGLPGPTMHQVNEQVRIADVEALTALYEAFFSRYLKG
ncbi:succinyldiaminopimelate desuccinylase [Devosia enhydra]|uniref:Succinyl-diaminopimelate desuccinylase n=1 Tax=Devosia enhydra TaxID=665118 RepID=A0A1K2I1Y0_9HYPH|nr:succinyl-diaminopimelate desuccinylase [Devosia enhydra]SFZ86402.1 succinyldiaminopimelate desuccinylase [Devosia enhydra]